MEVFVMNWERAQDFLSYQTARDWMRTYLTNNPPMPVHFVSVRHGESELNLANQRSRNGDDSAFTKEFRERHESQFRLTPKGVWQAQMARDWIRANINFKFNRLYVSEYVRAVETALHLEIPGARWFIDYNLRERDWGELGVIPQGERTEKYADILRLRQSQIFFWRPPSGESMADLSLRLNRLWSTLARECSRDNVLLSNHGEVDWGIRIAFERISLQRYIELDASKDPFDKIHNCQILHYTREDPFTGEITRYYNWMRSICPWDLSLSSNEWQRIVRPRYTNDDLKRIVESHPRFIS
jgi:NAD+ kinase